MKILYFVLGAGIGAPSRYLIEKSFRKIINFPIGILIANVIGSFIMGLSQLNYFVMGFCGAFTTWSAFMLEIDSTGLKRAATWINLFLTFTLSVLAIILGINLSN